MAENVGTDALDYIRKHFGDYPEFDDGVEKAYTGLMAGQMIYNARQEEDLTQSELAKRVGTTQSVISRLEDADYEGHSLPMLRKIAHALNRQVEMRFIPIDTKKGDRNKFEAALSRVPDVEPEEEDRF